MPTRIYTEDNIKRRKILSGDEKPPRKYTKTIKQEIKSEPMDLSDGDIDDDDVMDIEEADGTLPKKGKLLAKQKRVMKTKRVKKVPKVEKEKDGKEVAKVKPKRKKKPQPPATTTESTTPKAAAPADPSKPVKKVQKIKEKKVKPKSPRPAKKVDKDASKAANESDSDSSPGESDAYETCGVAKCQRPSGKIILRSLDSLIIENISSESVQDWILCDGGCEVWYHMVCVGLKIKEVKPDMEFICNNCKKSSDTQTGSQAAQK